MSDFKAEIKDKCQKVADEIQARLAGFDKGPKLFEEIDNQNERIQKLTTEVQYWKEKFDAMWKAWHNLALETKGAEEAAKMAEQIKKG